MKKLKTYTFSAMERIWLADYYLKSEADKVIAELEERIADGDKDFEIANNQNERLLKLVSRHKYKRCVELADSCAFRAIVAKMENRRFPTPKNSWRMILYPKWHRRWLAIAEKFKEAK